ncbi:hypothetical protein NBRC116589_12380 [Ruegeria sp. HU-ET01832]|uniref:methyltransferase domain-containing protein n=1 Tax=Ruegeria sp. HU-ET01832 TaxID=3135906 RepID=UPI00310853F5
MNGDRRLSAVLSADVVNYSGQIKADENRTLGELRVLRRELFDPLVSDHRGNVVKRMGDGDATFDYAFIQQGLQFFPDKSAALKEVHRILRNDGQLFLTCWRAVSPFNGALAKALEQHVGTDAAVKARAPFSFRDGDLISNLLVDAGFKIARHEPLVLERRFIDLRAQIMALPIETDLRDAGDDVTNKVVEEVADALSRYDNEGVLHVPQEAHLFVAAA